MMTKHLGAAVAFAALTAASLPAAMAAGDAKSASAQTIRADQIRSSKFVGSSVYDRDNQKIGSVQDIIFDRTGRVDSVIVDVGSYLGIGGKNVAVRFSDIKTDNNRLTLDRTKAQLQQTASFQLEDRNTGAGEGPSPVTGGRAGTRVTQ